MKRYHGGVFLAASVLLAACSSSSRDPVYELDDRGHATRRFDVMGSVTQWVRVR